MSHIKFRARCYLDYEIKETGWTCSMHREKNEYKVLIGVSEEKYLLEDLDVDGRVSLITIDF